MTIPLDETGYTVINVDDYYGWTPLKEDGENVYSLAELGFKSLREVIEAGHSYLACCVSYIDTKKMEDYTIVFHTLADAETFVAARSLPFAKFVLLTN